MSEPTKPPPKLHWGQRCINRCQADEDDCEWMDVRKFETMSRMRPGDTAHWM